MNKSINIEFLPNGNIRTELYLYPNQTLTNYEVAVGLSSSIRTISDAFSKRLKEQNGKDVDREEIQHNIYEFMVEDMKLGWSGEDAKPL